MTGWRSTPALAVAASILLHSPGAAASARADSGEPDHRTLFRFEDREITESSGLVDAGPVVYTVNDSGAGPLLYAVDPSTGETTGVTAYSDAEVEDVEALAPGTDGTVWVADIGDNLTRRDEVWVYRVTPGRGDAPRFGLSYPGPARDAETVLVHPRTGRLFVVSKSVFGSVVYAAPTELRPGRMHRVRRFAQVGGLLTDGAFFPDGRHVLLRGYGAAAVYSYPGFELRGRFTLPPQEQGEGVAVGRDGRILLSSEGTRAPVLELALPAEVTAAMAGPSLPAATPVPGSSPGAGQDDQATWAWAAGAAMLAGLLAVGLVGWRQRRR